MPGSLENKGNRAPLVKLLTTEPRLADFSEFAQGPVEELTVLIDEPAGSLDEEARDDIIMGLLEGLWRARDSP